MQLKILKNNLSVCQLSSLENVNLNQAPLFLSITEDEISLVCDTDVVPANALKSEDGWKAFMIEGELDFSLVGILSRISSLLADVGISIFAVSTYNTDYVLIKEDTLNSTISVLSKNHYDIVQEI